jgi:hypothetical protein
VKEKQIGDEYVNPSIDPITFEVELSDGQYDPITFKI